MVILPGALELAPDLGDGDTLDLFGASMPSLARDHALEVAE